MVAAAEPASARAIRCAIYTRKSTEEGLQQEFNSLDAQREAGEAFIAAGRSLCRATRSSKRRMTMTLA